MYEVPFEPVTRIDAALVSVTVRVSDCPADMVADCAVIDTVGTDAAAFNGEKAVTASKASRGHTEAKIFTGGRLTTNFLL